MLISAGVLCSTAGVSCDAAAAAGESCAFYASKPTASPIPSRSEAEIWKSGGGGIGSRASVSFKQLREEAGSGGESREVGMQKLKQGSASKSEGRLG